MIIPYLHVLTYTSFFSLLNKHGNMQKRKTDLEVEGTCGNYCMRGRSQLHKRVSVMKHIINIRQGQDWSSRESGIPGRTQSRNKASSCLKKGSIACQRVTLILPHQQSLCNIRGDVAWRLETGKLYGDDRRDSPYDQQRTQTHLNIPLWKMKKRNTGWFKFSEAISRNKLPQWSSW